MVNTNMMDFSDYHIPYRQVKVKTNNLAYFFMKINKRRDSFSLKSVTGIGFEIMVKTYSMIILSFEIQT